MRWSEIPMGGVTRIEPVEAVSCRQFQVDLTIEGKGRRKERRKILEMRT